MQLEPSTMNLNELNMQNCIHVPQGRVARIDKRAPREDIKSLFTYGISNCTVVACIGKERFSLLHIDSLSKLEVIEEESLWVGREVEVIILHRPAYIGGTSRYQRIFEILGKVGIIPSFHPLEDEFDGVLLSSEIVGQDNPHPKMVLYQKYSIPDNLLRHPKEQKIKTAQKMDQLFAIGNKDHLFKKNVIFDGLCWHEIPEKELHPFCPTQKHETFLKSLKKISKSRDLVNALTTFAEDLKRIYNSNFGMSTLQFAIDILFDVQNYLDGFQFVKVFKSNIVECAEELRDQPYQGNKMTVSKKDKKFCNQIIHTVNNSNDPYSKISKMMEEYKKGPQTEFSQQLVQEYEGIQKNYLESLMYHEHEKKNAAERKKVLELSKTASAFSKVEDFESAALQHEKSLALAHLEAGYALACLYFNYGSILSRRGEIAEAIVPLEIAVRICEEQEIVDDQGLEKFKNKLRKVKLDNKRLIQKSMQE